MTTTQALVIGVCGHTRAGKSHFADTIVHCANIYNITGTAIVRSRTILEKILAQRGIRADRSACQALVKEITDEKGPNAISGLMHDQILQESASGADLIILESVRLFSDANLVRGFDNHLMVFIEADASSRFEHMINSPNKKPGEEETTFEEFMKSEEAMTESFIDQIRLLANYEIVNNSSLALYTVSISNFFDHVLLPRIPVSA